MLDRWHLVAHVSELQNPGDFVALPVFGDGREIAVMNYEGYLHAWDNRCPHRGMRIFKESSGNRAPVCEYHGRCAKPHLLKTLSHCLVNGWVFVAGQTDPTKCVSLQLPMLVADILEEAPPDLTLYSRLQFTMDCDWTVAVENALDLEHVEHVHADSLARLGLTDEVLGSDTAPDGSSRARLHSSEAKRLDKLRQFFRSPGSAMPRNMDKPWDYEHTYFYPYAAVSSTRGFTYSLQNYWPQPDGRTHFLHRLYAAPANSPAAFNYFDSVARLNEKVFREDAAICAHVPADFPGVLGKGDERIACFRQQRGKWAAT
jgi:phenylpropionate dioxygenase-like ring-hydroxylating dioxygenase large terminal subunit